MNIVKRLTGVLLSLAVLFLSIEFPTITAFAATETITYDVPITPTYVDDSGYCTGYGYGTHSTVLVHIKTVHVENEMFYPMGAGGPSGFRNMDYVTFQCATCGYKTTVSGEKAHTLQTEALSHTMANSTSTTEVTLPLCTENYNAVLHTSELNDPVYLDTTCSKCSTFIGGYTMHCTACDKTFVAGRMHCQGGQYTDGGGGSAPVSWFDHYPLATTGTCPIHNTSALHFGLPTQSEPVVNWADARIKGLGYFGYPVNDPTKETATAHGYHTCEVCGKIVSGKHKAVQTSSITATNTTKTYGDATFSPFTYTGPTPTYTSSNTSVATINTSGVVTIVGAGTTTLTASIATTSSWTASTKSITLTINKASVTPTNVTASAITYGQTLASSRITGACTVPGNFSWKSPTTKPAVADSNKTACTYTYTPTSGNYNTYTGTLKLTVNKANPVVTTDPTRLAITYGQSLASSTFSGGSVTPAGSWAWVSPSTIPTVSTTKTYQAKYTPSDINNYNTLTKALSVTVNKATPTLYAAPTASAITYGQTLSNATLNGGSVSVAGRFEWEAPNTSPAAGTYTYTCRFVPNDTNSYNTITGISVTVRINKATPVITGGLTATPITYGQSLSASTVTGTSSTPGIFAFTQTSVKPAVANSNITAYAVAFTPNDTSNFTTVTGLSAKLTVNKKVPDISAVTVTGSNIFYGQPLSSSVLTASTRAEVDGTWNWTSPSLVPDIHQTTQSVTFYPTDSANYATNSKNATLTIDKASVVPASVTASGITYEQSLASSTITGSCAIPGTYTWVDSSIVPSVTDSNLTEYYYNFTPNDQIRYNTIYNLKTTLSVGKMTPEVSASMLSSVISPTLIYGEPLSNAPLTGTTPRPGHYEWVTPSYVPVVNDVAQPIKFVPDDTVNYTETSGFSVVPTVIKATPTIDSEITTTAITYGQSLSDSVISAETSVPGTWSWKEAYTMPAVVDSDTTSYTVVFTPDDTNNYNVIESTATVHVDKATPEVNMLSVFGTAITYEQTLADSTLSGFASVTGSFTWADTTIAPSVPDANTTTYSVTFTPDDTANYNIVYDIMVSLSVIPAIPTVVTAVSASGITYEDCLDDSTLSGEMSVPGTFTWVEPTICPFVADSNFTQYDVLFTPDDNINYQVVYLSTTISVDKMTPIFTDTEIASIYATEITYHDKLSDSLITGNSYVTGTFHWDEPDTEPTVPDSERTAYTITFIPDDTDNYNNVSGLTCTLKVNKYIQPVDPSVVTATAIAYEQTLGDSTLGGEPPIPGHFEWKDSTIAPTVPDSNSTCYEVIFYPDDDINHLPTENILIKLTINKADIKFTADEISTISTSTITFNQSLADSRITSLMSIPGHFVWTDTSIKPYVSDSDETEYAITYKPDDYINYNDNTSLTATVHVNKAVPVIDERNITATAITYGQTLGRSAISGTSPIPGTFTWFNNTIKPVVLDSGVARYQVIFTPTDLDNYEPNSNLYTTLTIFKADAVISVQDFSVPYSETPYDIGGTTNSEAPITYTVPSNDNLTVTYDGIVTMLKVGSQTITATVPETDNFYGTTKTLTFEITPAIANMSGTAVYNLFEYSDDFTLDVTTDIVGGVLTYNTTSSCITVDDTGNVEIVDVGTGIVNVHLNATGTNYQSADYFVQIYIRPDRNKDGIPDTGLDTDFDGRPDVNVDVDGDFYPDVDVDADGDLTPDINIDTDYDGTPDINIDTNHDNIADTNIDTDGDNITDLSIDTDGDGIRDLNIDDDHDGVPELNIDTDNDGNPEVNVDTNHDFVADINIDVDGDGIADINIDTDDDGVADVNIATGPDFIPSINLDGNRDGIPELNIDLDGDMTADINIDTNYDNLPDVNVDLDGDNIPDINIDTDGDFVPDINIDLDGDNIPDINIDLDGDGKPDINIDTNGDGIRDLNIDTDGDGIPDINIDIDGDGKPDINIDIDNDERADLNIDVDNDNVPDFDTDLDGDGVADLNIDIDKDGVSDLNTDINGDGVPDLDIDLNGDKVPDLNIDLDNDGKADVNIDTTGNGKPDINVDKDYDNIADINVDTNGNGKPDINIDLDGDDKPDINIDLDGDGKPDINIDLDGDNKPDINIDIDRDGVPDVNIDTDGDNKPDINVDLDGDDKPYINIDTDHDNRADVNIDTDGDGKPDVNIDINDDNKPDINIDTDGDSKPDVNIDLDNDSKPDINVDTDSDDKPDINIDTDNDGKPDTSIDLDNDGKPDINIDTDKDGKPDVNIDLNDDGNPDINIDTDNDGKADIDIDTTGDGKPDTNVDVDGDGKPDINIDNGDDSLNTNIDTDGDNKPDINIDLNGDGIPDLNIDINGDSIADISIDLDGDLIPDLNTCINGDLRPEVNIDSDGDLVADTNIDADKNSVVDVAEVAVDEELSKETTDKSFALNAEPIVTDNILVYSSLNGVLDVTQEGMVTINHAGTGQILIKSLPGAGSAAVQRMMYAARGTDVPIMQYDIVDGKIVTIEIAKADPEQSGGSPSEISISKNGKATITDGVKLDTKRTYVSSDEDVAVVSSKGVVHGVSEGTATITVTVAGNDMYNEVIKTYDITVTGNSSSDRPTRPDRPTGPSYTRPSTTTTTVTTPSKPKPSSTTPSSTTGNSVPTIPSKPKPSSTTSSSTTIATTPSSTTGASTPTRPNKPEPPSTTLPSSATDTSVAIPPSSAITEPVIATEEPVVETEETLFTVEESTETEEEEPVFETIEDPEIADAPTEDDNTDIPVKPIIPTAPPPAIDNDEDDDESDSNRGGGGGSNDHDPYENPPTGVHSTFLGTALAAALSMVFTIKRRKSK